MILPLVWGKRRTLRSQLVATLRFSFALSDCLLRTDGLILLAAIFASHTGGFGYGHVSVSALACARWLMFSFQARRRKPGSYRALLLLVLLALWDHRRPRP